MWLDKKLKINKLIKLKSFAEFFLIGGFRRNSKIEIFLQLNFSAYSNYKPQQNRSFIISLI